MALRCAPDHGTPSCKLPAKDPTTALITIELPTLLERFADGSATVEVTGGSVRDALDSLFTKHPALRVHILDEKTHLRQHVLCFHNGVNTRWNESLDIPVKDGDRITIMQAVSGG